MQNLIVILIGIAVFSYVSWKIYKMVIRKPSPADKCGGCTGCALKVNIECTTKKMEDKEFKLMV